MSKLAGKIFYYRYLSEIIKFTLTRDTKNAYRFIINDSIQAIWLPKYYISINENLIKAKNIDWKLKSSEFKRKLKLTKTSDSYMDRHGKNPGWQ